MRQESTYRRKLNNAGFTLVEQIVVLVLVLIAAGGLVFGIIRWVEWSQFKQQNEYAQTLFVAAQNQLTEYSRADQLTKVEDVGTVIATSEKITTEGMTNGEGNAYDLSSIWPESSNKGSKYRGEIRSLTGTKEDYQAYINGEGTEETKALYDMLSSYVYDPSLLNATICVEYTPEDGQVFAVLYSNSADAFEYNAGNENRKGTVDITQRERTTRKSRMVGYYGVDTLSKATTTDVDRPSITNVKLNNSETLNLTYKLRNNDDSQAQKMTYEIFVRTEVNGKDTPLFSFTLDGTKIKNENNLGMQAGIDCTVTRYNQTEDGQVSQDMGTYPILAWIDTEEMIHIVLDAADLDATSSLYYDAYSELADTTKNRQESAELSSLKKTYSFLRFGVLNNHTANSIYCTVQGNGVGDRPTAKKSSNSENPYFASARITEKTSGGTNGDAAGDTEETLPETAVYGIENSRHLYNMRYLEDYEAYIKTLTGEAANSGIIVKEETDLKSAKTVTYRLTDNQDWVAFLGAKALFESGIVKGNSAAFPSIKELRSCATLESNGNRTYTIRRLKVTLEDNCSKFLYGAEESREAKTGPVGLFITNSGTLQKIAMDKAEILGGDQVGAFCGVNAGTLKNLTLANTDQEYQSTVIGNESVGGIAGTLGANGKIECSDLVNRGIIYGNTSVGGIFGFVQTSANQTVSISNCKNYGVTEVIVRSISNTETSDDISVPVQSNQRYFGGIVGRTENVANGAALTLQNCTSSPQYDEELLTNNAYLEEKLQGDYVGGIIGYNCGATLVGCNTEKENGSKEGFIFGNNYVGGIVGYNGIIEDQETDADGVVSDESKVLDGTKNNVQGTNEAHVLGKSYVGGIVGINEDDYTVKNWNNEGTVAAVDSYAGGITGNNNGTVSHCGSNMDNGTIMSGFRNMGMFHGDYVGGIAGYNSGQLEGGEEGISVVSYAFGNNYVGGIVGYNDTDASVTDYQVSGGYVNAAGSFVGGFAGVNAATELVSNNKRLVSNPNEVTGQYCVGGIIGANIVAPSNDISAVFYSDNFLGRLNAEAFAGGFIGYNQLTTNSEEEIRTFLQEKADQFDETEGVENVLQVMETNTLGTSPAFRMYIQGNNAGESTTSRLGEIRAQIYVGGVVGYNQEETLLTIANVENMTQVIAETAIENTEEQGADKIALGDQPFTYSYAGGIIGKVTKEVVIDNCRNSNAGDVSTSGTYLGGISEINEGTIQNCAVSSIGNRMQNYVGGITGLNKSGATIQDCTFESRTVTGQYFVGGIAAENYGTIHNMTLSNARINAESTVGGIAGYAHEESRVVLGDITGTVTVSTNGDRVGGAIGVNEGEMTAAEGVSTSYMVGSVSGNTHVGGFVGENRAGALRNLTNEAIVTATSGNVGGIAGVNEQGSESVIENCENSGNVTASRSGDAGGIVSANAGTIQGATNYANVTAANGLAGGITGKNTGTIQGSATKPGILATVISGSDSVGGICASNIGENAEISMCIVEGGVQIQNQSTSEGSSIGGIAGRNESGTIQACTIGNDSGRLNLIANASGVYMGGVAGYNSGNIRGEADIYTLVNANLRFTLTEMSYYGNLGGIAGANNGGNIQYCEFNGTVAGTANNPQLSPQYNPNRDTETNGSVIYGYGGIAGVNGDSGAASSGIIENCRVNIAKITGLGDPSNITNVGGIAGVNGLGAMIQDVEIGTGVQDTYATLGAGGSNLETVRNAKSAVYVGTGESSTGYGHTGGIAGLNSGLVENIYYEAQTDGSGTYDEQVDSTSVIVENTRGHVGGITGYNRRTGILRQVSSGENWVVFAPESAQDNGCGGIVGYQAFDTEMKRCYNRATVEKTASGSNAVGGMVGRLETATNSSWMISECVNYGTIKGANRAGGIIGIWKYYGGTVSDCVNYGSVTAGSEGEGGIVGHLYAVTTTPAIIRRCENHGMIMGTKAGGILGTHGGSSTLFQLYSCVNTGMIQEGNSNGGIVGALPNRCATSRIESCTNYGYGRTGAGVLSSNLSGILAADSNEAQIVNCYGIANVQYPISVNFGADTGNFYVTNSKGSVDSIYYDKQGTVTSDIPEAFYVKTIEMQKGSGMTVNAADKLYLAVYGRDSLAMQRAWFNNTSASSGAVSGTYTFTFSTGIDLNGMDLYWNREGTQKRATDYIVWYSPYSEGDNWIQYATQNTATEGNFTDEPLESISGDSVKALRVKIEITKSINNTGKGAHASLLRAYFKGSVFGTSYDGEEGYLVKTDTGCKYVKYEATDDELNYAYSGGKITYNGLGYERIIYMRPSDDIAKGKGNGVNVVSHDGNTYKLVLSNEDGDSIIGIPGFSIDPWTTFVRASDLGSTSLTQMGDVNDNIRYQVFEADQLYFTSGSSYNITSLSAPKNIVFTTGNAEYNVKWNVVPNASYYEYAAVYKDADGKVLQTRSDRIYSTSIGIPVGQINGVDVSEIEFSVRAGTYVAGEQGVVELWSAETKATQKVASLLPMPEYHLELVIVKEKDKENGDEKDVLKYRAYLDNQDEYRTFLKTQGVDDVEMEEALEKITITIQYNSSTIKDLEMTALQGYSDGTYEGDGAARNATFSAYASSAGYLSSTKGMRESQSPKDIEFKSGSTFADVSMVPDEKNQVGFRGTTADTLSYQLKIARGDITAILYMRSEMMATVADMNSVLQGLPISVSNSQLRTSDTTIGAIATSLTGLPTNLLDADAYEDLQIRSYPLMISNNLFYMGHTVVEVKKEGNAQAYEKTKKSSWTEAELMNLYVTSDNYVTTDASAETRLITSSADGSRKTLADGFVIELAPDGQNYTLYFNTLLQYNDVNDYSYNKDTGSTGGMKTQVFYYHLRSNVTEKRQPKPVIYINDDNRKGQDGDPNADTMVITWDLNKDSYIGEGQSKNNYKVGAIYDYQITGQLEAGGETILIAEGTYTTTQGQENCLEYDTTLWDSYKTVNISISRRGEVNSSSGMTTILPTGAVKSAELKTRFTELTVPTVSLHKDSNGNVEKNTLIYDVQWNNLPLAERASKELLGYEVTVSPTEEGDTTSYDTQAGFKSALDAAKSLYGKKRDVKVTEEPEKQQITYVWTETTNSEGSNGETRKTMVLSWTEDTTKNQWTLTKHLTQVYVFAVADEDRKEESNSVIRQIDLNDYSRSESLEVAVRALATTDATEYRNSVQSDPRTITLPSRLDVADITKLDTDDVFKYAEDKFVTLDQYDAGLNVTLKPEDESGETLGHYEIAIAVYDDKPEDPHDVAKVKNAGDAPDGNEGNEGYWNTGALVTLNKKSAVTVMDGNLLEAAYTIRLEKPEYAGKWLKIAVRSVSDNNISSYWTDEDETEDATVNYRWIQIPRIQIAEPIAVQTSKELYYDSNNGLWRGDPNQTTKTDEKDYSLSQTVLQFAHVENVDAYKLQLIHSGENRSDLGESDYSISYVDWLYVERNAEGSYDVYYLTSDPKVDLSADHYHPADKGSMVNSDAAYLGTLAKVDSWIKLPYSAAVLTGAGESADSIDAISYLHWIKDSETGEKEQFELVLPDTEKIDDKIDVESLFTLQASSQALVNERNMLRYADSTVSNWYRTNSGADIVSLKDYLDAPEVDVTLKASALDGIAYQLEATYDSRWLVYEVMLTNEQEAELHYYISAYGDGTTSIHNIALLPDEQFADKAGWKISVRAATINPGEHDPETPTGGLSKWSDWTPLGTLDTLKVNPEVKQGIDESSDETGVTTYQVFKWTQPAQGKIKEYEIDFGDTDPIKTEESPEGESTYALSIEAVEEDKILNVSAKLTITKNLTERTFEIKLPSKISIKDEVYTLKSSVSIKAIPKNDNYEGESYTWQSTEGVTSD